MITLASIQQTRHASPPRIVIHGSEKVGKSTFASQAPCPIFIRTEDGLNGIDTTAFPLADKYQDVRDSLSALATQSHNFKTVIIDSADWLERIIHEEICTNEKVKTVAKAGGGYGQGYITAMSYWREIVKALDWLNKNLGMITIIICHSEVSEMRDPEHESYDIAKLKLHKSSTALLCEWADIIGYAKRPIIVSKNDSGEHKAINTGNVNNELVIGKSPTCVSGNRYGIAQQIIPLNWDALQQSINQSM